MSRKLLIGSTEKVSGWDVFNIVPGPQVDQVGDARDLSRFHDNTFTALYASHVLEHFDYLGVLSAVLTEWHRVLMPGGVLYVSVPDLDRLTKLFLFRDGLTIHERFHVMRMMFGGHVDHYKPSRV